MRFSHVISYLVFRWKNVNARKTIFLISCYFFAYTARNSLGHADWSVWHMRRVWESCIYSAWRQEGLGGISSFCINVRWEGMKKETGSFQWCPVTRHEAVTTNINTGNSFWSFFLWHWWNTGAGCHERLFILVDIQNPTGHCAESNVL